ncbi:DMT family transporter [Archangium gephyra]|uniref:EamA family transporter n=1 Tax=Archangium gephyra TaxID=48 RepID=UPI0035D52854
MGSTGKNRLAARAAAAGIASIAIWSVAPVLVKWGVSGANIALFLVLRFTISALGFVGMVPTLWARRRSLPGRIWGLLFLCLGANFYLQTLALETLPAAAYIVLFALNPLLSFLVLRLPLTRRTVAAAAGAILGAAVFMAAGDGSWALPRPAGLLAMAGGMLTWVMYTALLPPLQRVYTDAEVSGVTNLVALAAVAPVCLAHLVSGTGLELPGRALIAAIALGVLLPLAYWMFSYSVRRAPVFGILCQYLEPVLGVLLAVLLLGERLLLHQFVGGAIVITAMGLVPLSPSNT